MEWVLGFIIGFVVMPLFIHWWHEYTLGKK